MTASFYYGLCLFVLLVGTALVLSATWKDDGDD